MRRYASPHPEYPMTFATAHSPAERMKSTFGLGRENCTIHVHFRGNDNYHANSRISQNTTC